MHKTAFLVMVNANGDVSITTDPKDLGVEVEQEATLRVIRRAVTEITADLNAQAAAQYVASTLLYEAPQAAEPEAEAAE